MFKDFVTDYLAKIRYRKNWLDVIESHWIVAYPYSYKRLFIND